MSQLFLGQIVHSKSFDELETIPDGFLAIENGRISAIGERSALPKHLSETLPVTQLSPTQFLIPGFIDCHIHAPQYPNSGLGLDMPLLKWLNTYTFPMEHNFRDEKFAEKVYAAVVHRTLSCGTTLAAYFATNHKNSSFLLAQEAVRQGQRALVGKVSSNCSSPDFYVETTEASLQDNAEFIERVLGLQSPLVRPIVTPRFAISCNTELMQGLAQLAAKHDLHIQSHISENLNEIAYVKELFNAKNYASVYENVNLLTQKCVLAHGVHLEDEELQILKKNGTAIAHCPTSNTSLGSGLCDVQRLLAANVKVGLGTDVSGGYSASMLTAIRDAMSVSHHLDFFKKQNIIGSGQIANPDAAHNANYRPLSYRNALYLATLGGAQALALDTTVGNFAIGKDFDALLVDVGVQPLDVFPIPSGEGSVQDSVQKLLKMVQKFVYVGDDRNILKVFVAGKQVKV